MKINQIFKNLFPTLLFQYGYTVAYITNYNITWEGNSLRPKENKDERKQRKIIPDVCSMCKIHGSRSCHLGRDRLKIFLGAS